MLEKNVASECAIEVFGSVFRLVCGGMRFRTNLMKRSSESP